jgi:D-arabinose 1-dehydrogenase-like Zn-dependent alcohol dehydrogenase
MDSEASNRISKLERQVVELRAIANVQAFALAMVETQIMGLLNLDRHKYEAILESGFRHMLANPTVSAMSPTETDNLFAEMQEAAERLMIQIKTMDIPKTDIAE